MADKIKVYVAGGSRELLRAQLMMRALRESPRFEIARDWPADIEKERFDNGKADSDLTREEQEVYARANLTAVLESDILWLLSPSEVIHTVGAWVELGAALVTGPMRMAVGLSPITVIVSGATADHHLFNSLADHTFNRDSEAHDWLMIRAAS